MKNKVVIGVLVTAIALLAVILWPRLNQDAAVGHSSKASGGTNGAKVPAHNSSEGAGTAAASPALAEPAAVAPEALKSLEAALAAREELNPTQVGTVFQLLREVHPLDGDQNGQVRKNGLMNALNRQSTLPPDALALYAGIYRDPAQDEVIRDYAIQHVYEAYDKLADAGQRAAAVELLREAARVSESSTAGTAILALARLAEQDAGISRTDVAVIAFDLARNPAANPSARISALQIVGRLDAPAAVPLLVQTVRDESAVTVRLSAIGALGQCGGRGEVAVLRSIAEGDNERLKPAALKAIQRIQERTKSI